MHINIHKVIVVFLIIVGINCYSSAQSELRLGLGLNYTIPIGLREYTFGHAYQHQRLLNPEIRLNYRTELSESLFLVFDLGLAIHGLQFQHYDIYRSTELIHVFDRSKYSFYTSLIEVKLGILFSRKVSIGVGYGVRAMFHGKDKSVVTFVDDQKIVNKDLENTSYNSPQTLLHGPTLDITIEISEKFSVNLGAWADLTSTTRFPSNWGVFVCECELVQIDYIIPKISLLYNLNFKK